MPRNAAERCGRVRGLPRPSAARLLFVGLVASLLAVSAAAQDDTKGPDPERAQKYLVAAFKLRHDGKLDQAAVAFDVVISLFPDGPDKRQAQLEAHELAVLEGKFDRAARIAHGWDRDREAIALARDKKPDLALKVAREANDPLVEGRVLHALGRDAEALVALEKAGRPGALDRGELLMRMGKPIDAARAFEDASDVLRRALALERTKDPAATIAFEAAKVEDRARLDSLIAKEKDARAALAKAAPGIAQDRARYALAEALEQLIDGSERLSISLEKTSEKAKAADLAQAALDATRSERDTLGSGGDKYGALLAQERGVDARIKRLEERVKTLRS